MKFLLNLVLLAFILPAFSQTPAFDKNAQLGRGINLGNMFEAPTEIEWGNPFQDEYMQRIAALGFNHVRIPVRWEPADRSLATPPYTIKQEFITRIQHVVDLALKHKLHPIINMHHHEALFEGPDGQKERFLSMWKQISEHFSAYSDSLVFELLNEPHANLTAEKWNSLLVEGINTVRESSPTRFIVVGTAEYGGLGGLPKLQLPDDNRLILTVHYYNPFSFTHQGAEWTGGEAGQWLGTKWMDTESERLTIQSEFAAAIQYSNDHNIPVHVGEFGAYSKADLASRVRWTTYLARYFESQGFSWAYWEFSAGFGIYSPSTQTYLQELVDALLHNPMPDATPVNRKEIIKSGFNTDGNKEGWNLYSSGGASASASVSSGNFNINTQNGGTESWHVQLVLNNILLEKGKDYEVQVSAKAGENYPISVYAGMNKDPWSSYSGYSGFGLTSEFKLFTVSFQMQGTSDTQARLVIDMGKSTSAVTIDEISLYETSLVTGNPELTKDEAFFYPNPTTGTISFINGGFNNWVSVYSISGALLLKKELPTGNKQINLESFPHGQYIVHWQNGQLTQAGKVVKI